MADRGEIGRESMGVGAGACGLVGRQTLCEKSRHNAAEKIAGATLCHTGISGRDQGRLPIGGADESAGAL